MESGFQKVTTRLGQMSLAKLRHPQWSHPSLFPIPSPKSLAVHQPEVLAQEQSTNADGPFSGCSSFAVFILYICTYVPCFFFFSLNGYVLVDRISLPSSPRMAVHDTRHCSCALFMLCFTKPLVAAAFFGGCNALYQSALSSLL
jgi:hypothetical protein